MTRLSFQQEIQAVEINLPRAALCFAQEIGYPALDIEHYLRQLDELAVAASPIVCVHADLLSRVVSLAQFLFEGVGFQGNAAEYTDPRNSYLNEVLDRRLGIPISLSVIFLAVAERLEIPAQGVGLPGHFIVSAPGENGPLFLDPFHAGRQISVIDCARLVELSTGYSGAFQIEWLRPVTAGEILARMLYNLRNVYIQQDKWRMAQPAVERLQMLQPENPDHLRDLGTIHRQNGSLRLAIDYYQRYLSLVPEAEDASLVRRNLKETAEKLAKRN